MKLFLVAAACLALAFGDGHEGMEHGTIVEELTKAGWDGMGWDKVWVLVSP